MIIDITGFGWSGSGAIIDLLSEYDDVQVLKGIELSLLYNVDGIKDLEYKLLEKHSRVFDSDVAIKRFLHLIESQYKIDKRIVNLTRNYIKSLVGIEFYSRSIYDRIYFPSYKYQLSGVYNFLIKKTIGNKYIGPKVGKRIVNSLKIHNRNKKYLSYNPGSFIDETHIFLSQLLELFNDGSNRPYVTDHLFPPDDPRPYFNYFVDGIKCIIVRRDPRDTYILAKEIYKSAIPIPVDTINDFVWFYKNTIEDQYVSDSTEILNIKFEDLIYNYDVTIKRIESFLNIYQHNRVKQIFDPDISINNTRLFKRFDKYKDDIAFIEEKLKESLYPFDDRSNLKCSNYKVF